MAPQELVRDAVERVAISGHEGKSGAGLERVRLGDGRLLVVKRIDPATDFTVALTGGGPGSEYMLWRSGVFERLPPGVTTPHVDAWTEGDITVLVMRDLGDAMLTWQDRLPARACDLVMRRVAAVHRTYLDEVPECTVGLDRVLALFAPATVRPLADQGVELMQLVLRGWELFSEEVADDVVDELFALLENVRPLQRALEACPVTMTHGDLATVNMALEGDSLVLIDWAMATRAPGSLDIARFLAGCASVCELSREELLAAYQKHAGPAYDVRSMGLALLSGLLWLGWNKALDAVAHPDPVVRARERADLDWWVTRARNTLERGIA